METGRRGDGETGRRGAEQGLTTSHDAPGHQYCRGGAYQHEPGGVDPPDNTHHPNFAAAGDASGTARGAHHWVDEDEAAQYLSRYRRGQTVALVLNEWTQVGGRSAGAIQAGVAGTSRSTLPYTRAGGAEYN